MQDRGPRHLPPGTRVIVADDDEDLRTLVAETLRGDGYAVTEARDGVELLELIADAIDNSATRPEIVVTDIRMPYLSGLGVLDHLKNAHVDIPVVLMTGFASDAVAVVARHLGAFGLLGKPFDLDDLRTAVLNAPHDPSRGAGRPRR